MKALKVHSKFSDFFLITIFIFLLIAAGMLNRSFDRPNITINKQESAVNFNNYFLLFFAAGNKRLLADLFWISSLLESDLEHYKKKDLNSWLYLRFKTITTLDPKYLRAYQFGGQYLGIVKDDLNGAKEIFDLGLKHYPFDYKLLFNNAFLHTFEIGDFQSGLKLYKKLLDTGKAPQFVKSLVPKLQYKLSGELDLAYQTLKEMLKDTIPNTYLHKKIKQDIYSIKAQIDLKCLNSTSINCEKFDYDGNEYIYEDGKFRAIKKFKYYKLQVFGNEE